MGGMPMPEGLLGDLVGEEGPGDRSGDEEDPPALMLRENDEPAEGESEGSEDEQQLMQDVGSDDETEATEGAPGDKAQAAAGDAGDAGDYG
jgi:hypothetical protein